MSGRAVGLCPQSGEDADSFRRNNAQGCQTCARREETNTPGAVAQNAHPQIWPIAQIQKAFGWQPYTARAAISAQRKAGFEISRSNTDKGPGYWIVERGRNQ